MKIWFSYNICSGGGTDVYTEHLAKATVSAGHEAVVSRFAHCWQYCPWRLRLIEPPLGVDVILANTWNGFAFHRPKSKLVVVEHLCIFDPAYVLYRSLLQAVFHETLVRRFEQASLRVAEALVAVSAYTARMVRKALGGPMAEVIHNGIDTDFFCSGQQAKIYPKKPHSASFVCWQSVPAKRCGSFARYYAQTLTWLWVALHERLEDQCPICEYA